jgi:F-type H+-transporting ATPase subunit beta
MINLKDTSDKLNFGKIISFRVSVIDAYFEHSCPAVYALLYVGEHQEIAIEVMSQLNETTVRGIA